MKRLEKSNDRLLVVDDEKEPSIFDYLGFESHDCRNYAVVITGDEEKLLLICCKCGRGLVEPRREGDKERL